MKNQLFAYLLVLLSGTVNAQGVVLKCGEQKPLLFPKQVFSSDKENLDITSDKGEIIGKNSYLLSGEASIRSVEYYLAADEITIQKANKTASAKGHVKLQERDLMMTAETAMLEEQNGLNHITLKQANYHYPATKINGSAQTITANSGKYLLDAVSYSLCPLGNSDWQMLADEITLNTSTNRGVAKNVTIEFFGVPLFYIPRYNWVLKGRSSGLLSPTFASYNESNDGGNGYQVKIPYYFNIAPDRDLLLTLNQLSTRGSVIEAKYRQLIVNDGQVEIEGHYLNEDDITRKKRWLLNSKLDLSLNEKIRLNIHTNRVSDQNYFKEITREKISEDALQSHIDWAYTDKEKDLSIALFAEDEQLINDGVATYTRAPEISVIKGIDGIGNRRIKLSLVSTKFAHKTAGNTTGVRTHAQSVFTRSISGNAFSLSPKLNLSSTDYSLDNAPDQRRNLAQFTLDSKLFLERETRFFSKNLLQTLTPRLSYNYTPKRNQSALPNFDSAEKNNSYEGLFSGRKFTGLDKISNANNFTVGLESDFIDNKTGQTYLSLKAAQIYYLDDTDLDINGNFVNRRDYSNIALSADLTIDDFTFTNALQFDPEENTLNRRDSIATYLLGPRKFLTIAHHDDNGSKTAEVYGAYPLTKNVHVFAGINRSITDSITSRATAGIAYESCCWALRLAHFKKYIGANEFDYTTKFELVLKGLSSTSPKLYQRLEEEIPNYLGNLSNL